MTLAAPSRSAPDVAEDRDTRERILLVAERLFSEHGYAGVSLRSIMAAAEANTAAVHYYFRSKEGLLRAIFQMRIGPMSAERHALFDAVEREADGQAPELRMVLDAFFRPAIRRSRSPEGEAFNKVSALCSVDPNPAVRQIVFDVYDEVARRFVGLLRRACPHLNDEAFYWRLNCLYGSMMYVRAHNGRVAYLVGNDRPEGDAQTVLDELVAFTGAGLLAPATQ
jgi:AcrR family transcriptional regulator